MSQCNQSGTNSQRLNQHVRRIMMKIARHTKRGWNVSGLERELALSLGDAKRQVFKTGRSSDQRYVTRGRAPVDSE